MASESSEFVPFGDTRPWRPVRLATLVRLRWLAVAGQTASVIITVAVLGFPIPVTPCLVLIALSAILNIVLQLRYGAGYRLSAGYAAGLLAFDCAQLGGLLWLTGGLENPFAILLIAPVSVSATTLDTRLTVLLAALAVCIASVLAVSHLPLPWSAAEPLHEPPLLVAGIWIALLLGVVFISAYTNRVAHEARQMADALAATELALSRQQRLRALDGLAAAAAHELGTPLSTIALAAKEMLAEPGSEPLKEDIELIIAQIVRCRAILGKLRNLDSEKPDPFATVPLGDLLAEVASPYEHLGKTVLFEVEGPGPGPVIPRSVGLIYGLGNLVENAVHFAKSRVTITSRWTSDRVELSITDDGPGFAPDLIARLGEPYITSRPRNPADSAAPGGLGLGVFIAKTLLERTGATLAFANSAATGHAAVSVAWSRAALADSAPPG